jgi:RND family efflux transporter MFP subunit
MRFILWSLATLLLAAGCGPSSGNPSAAPAEPPAISVAVGHPEPTTLRRTVQQPGSVQGFEQTPIYAKVPGYVQKWNVDRGDLVKKGDVLAELWVPELAVDVRQKEALAAQAEVEIVQAKEAATAAEKAYQSSLAKVAEAESARQRAVAERERMKSQSERLAQAGNQSGVLSRESIEESRLGYEAARAGVAEVEARIHSAEALRDESKAKWDKARADILVAEARLRVARENREYAGIMLDYTHLTAPYDGVVTRRNVNTRDFVQPPTGARGDALYVVERRDRMRAVVEVPETDATWVSKGARATIRIPALKGRTFAGEVARTSYSLDRTTRTLVAEIDLPNPDDALRGNMYVNATITTERLDVLSVPASAIQTQGDVTQGYQTYCFLVEGGHLRKTAIQLGARGDDRVEVLKKEIKPSGAGEKPAWADFTGDEMIVQGNLAGLADAQAVRADSR